MKRLVILGSTGSIGTQTLDVVRQNPDGFKVVALTCARREKEMLEQAEEFGVPREHCYTCNGTYEENVKKLIEAATLDCDLVVNSLMGMRGLEPTYHALMSGHDVALANKETLVAGGSIIMKLARDRGLKLLPIDSEHSAIFQCLEGNQGRAIKKILLTCSGGPFRGKKREDMEGVTAAQALKHPKWNMGKKITIDSATLMNKGLEVIEARWLFGVKPEQIQVVVHPQSIVHSGVEFEDTSVLTQMGLPDMRIPISYALEYPNRCVNDFESLDFFSTASELTFEKPDMETFKCIGFAYRALEEGGTLAAAMNGANEVLVQQFLEKKIRFIDIQDTLEKIMDTHENSFDMSIDNILEADRLAREKTMEILNA